MTEAEAIALHRKYTSGDESFDLVFTHCKIVAEIAAWAADNAGSPVDRTKLYEACILHDIGTYALYSPELKKFKGRQDGYQLHALIGAALLEEEGFEREVAAAVRTHVLLGITAEEIRRVGWKLPHKDFLPETELGELLCYADRFHSTHQVFNTPEPFLKKLRQEFPKQAEKFERAMEKYGIPDLEKLAQKYNHPIR